MNPSSSTGNRRHQLARGFLLLGVCLLAQAILSPKAQAQAETWTAGTSGYWTTSNNWTPSANYPGGTTGQSAIIQSTTNAPQVVSVTNSPANPIASLTMQQGTNSGTNELDIDSGATLSISSNTPITETTTNNATEVAD